MFTEAAQSVAIVVGVGGLGGLAMWRLMFAQDRRPMHLHGESLTTIAIQPDGSVYVAKDKPRLGGATKAPRLRAKGVRT